MRYRLWPVALALTCAGCTTSVAGTAAPGNTLPTTTTTTSTPPTAADGADLAACADGTCEVTVAPDAVVDTAQNFGVHPIRVGAIGADDVMLVVAMINGGTFGCDHDDRCAVSLTGQTAEGPAIAQVTAHPGAEVTAVGLTIDVVAVSDGHAIIRLTPTT